MASTLIATPGATDANSYITLAEGEEIATCSLNTGKWGESDSTDERKTKALQEATRLIDPYIVFNGYPSTSSQVLAFPRYGLLLPNLYTEIPRVTIPEPIKIATWQMARALLTTDLSSPVTAASSGDVIEEKFGPITFKYSSGVSSQTRVLPVNVSAVIPSDWIRSFRSNPGGVSVTKKLRS